MKTNIIFSIATFLIISRLFGQQGCAFPNPPAWFDPNWSWTIPFNTPNDPNHWNAVIGNPNGPTIVNIQSPFVSGGTSDVDDLQYFLDYEPDQGWILLYKDFGYVDTINLNTFAAKNDIPVFILYNKYRSLMRIFLWSNYTSPFNFAYVTSEWENPTTFGYHNSLLGFGSKNLKSTNDYLPLLTNTDKVAMHINDLANHDWMVVEFPVHFDPNTSDMTFGQRLKFIYRNGTSSTINIDGNFSFTSKSAIAKDPPASTPVNGNNNALDFVNSAREFLGKVPNRTELTASFNAMASASGTLNEVFSNKFTNSISAINNSLQNGNLKKYLLAAADVAAFADGGLGIIGGLLKTFIGKANPDLAANDQKYIEPTISSGAITLTGTITTEAISKQFELELPGTKHTNASGCYNYNKMPYYDCPLGVISIEDMPVLNKKTFVKPKQSAYWTAGRDYYVTEPFGQCDPFNNHNQSLVANVTAFPNGNGPIIGNIFNRFDNFSIQYGFQAINSFQISGKIKLALNESAGVEIISTQAALYFEIEKRTNGTPAFILQPYNLIDTADWGNIELTLNPAMDAEKPECWPQWFAYAIPGQNTLSKTILDPYRNLTLDLLNREVLDLSDFKDNGLHGFQTPFIEMDKFDGTAITIQDSAKPYLKILVVMKPTNPLHDQTPITYILTYEFPNNKINTINGGNVLVEYPMTCEQRINDNSSITKIPGVATINPSNITNLGVVLGDNSNNLVSANANGGLIDVTANNYINVKSQFISTSSNGGSMRLHISPSNACVAGGDSKQINSYFSQCIPTNYRIRSNIDPQRIESESLNLVNEISLYPNPNNGFFTLRFNEEIQEGTLCIYNDLGVKLFEKEVAKAMKMEIDISYFSKGIYILSIKSNSNLTKPVKFIIN